jgi:TFIIH basal transcription factor complex TTD-A subunit
LLHLDEELHFIVRDLDDSHVFVKQEFVEIIQARLDKLMDDNTFIPIDGTEVK